MAAAALADADTAALTQPVDAEGREEHMQQAGVIGVAHVLRIELPVVRQYFGKAADHL